MGLPLSAVAGALPRVVSFFDRISRAEKFSFDEAGSEEEQWITVIFPSFL